MLKKNLSALLLILLLAFLSLPVHLVWGGSGGELSVGVPVSGEIAERGEQDVYTYAGSSGESITITATATGELDTFLELYDPNGELVVSNDDSESDLSTTNSELQVTLNADGNYTVTVQAFAGASTGAYELLLVVGDISTTPEATGTPDTDATPEVTETPEASETPEPETTPTAQTSIAYGETVNGELFADEVVEYSFMGSSGDFVRVLVSADIDTQLEIRDANGQTLAYDDDSGPDVNPFIRSFRLPTDGEYRLALSSFFGDSEGNYEISLTHIEAAGEQTIAYGETQSAELEAGGIHVFTFEAVANDIISVSVQGDFDSVLDLITPSNQLLVSDDDSGGSGQPALYEITLPEAGSYSLAITGFDLNQGGAFEITLNNVTGTVSATDETIAYGDSVEGNINTAGRVAYLFNGTAGDTITVAVEADFDGYLEIYDPSDLLLASDDDGGDGLNPLIQNVELPADGEYRIEFSVFGASSGGAYTLTLTSGDVVAEPPTENTLAFGDTVEGELSGGEPAVYTFNAESGDTVTITVAAEFDGFLELTDPLGSVVGRDDDSGEGLNPLLENISLTESGTYTISLATFSGQESGAYSISLSAGEAVVTEPTTAEAEIIELGELRITLLTAGTTNQYVFNAVAGDVISISATADTPDLDLYLEIYTPSGTLLAADDDSGWGFNPTIAGIELPEDGTYRLDVSSFAGAGGGQFWLLLDRGLAYVAPNGVYAEPLVMDGGSASLNVSDSALYAFDGVAGQTITVEAGGLNADLYSADGAIETSLASGTVFELPADGTYLLYVYGGQAEVQVALSTASTVPEATTLFGGDVAVDVPATGTLEANQTQTWTFKPLLSGQYTFVLNSRDEAKRYDPYLTLRDADGNVLGQDDDSGGNFDALLQGVSLTGGQAVTLEVSGFAGQTGGAYILAVVADSVEEPTAVSGGDLVLGEAVNSALETPSQQAEFNLTVDSDGAFNLTLDGLKLPYIDIYDTDNNLVGRGVGIIENQKLAAGSYRVVVYDRLNRIGDFTLTVERIEE